MTSYEKGWREAIEQAAKVADAYVKFCDRENDAARFGRRAAEIIAHRIRSLAAPLPENHERTDP